MHLVLFKTRLRPESKLCSSSDPLLASQSARAKSEHCSFDLVRKRSTDCYRYF